MKSIFTTIIAIVCLVLTIHAQNYYVSSGATINGSGSILSPWNSFAPLNLLLATSTPIDTIFLKSGDIFREQITVAAASNFVITSYGTGNKPIISGADSVLTWTPVSDYWQANFSQPIVNFFVNNQEQILARYPDESAPYLTVDAGTTSSTLNDAGLSIFSSSILNQSRVCVHTAQWCWEKSPVTSSTNNTITYLDTTLIVPTANYGYFLYDHLSYLTTGKEWKYDAANQKIYYHPVSGTPNTLLCEASVRPYGILINSGVSTINISNIAFEKQSQSGVSISNTSNNIIIGNCYFARQYKYGAEVYGKYAKISNNYFKEVDGLAIYLNASGTGAEVDHNIFRNNGGFRNSGIGTQINLSSIKGAFVDSCHIHHNNIDSAGYCGIAVDGKQNLIERNIIQNAMLLNNDGAALKSFGVASQYNVFRNNFVSTSDGNTDGTPPGNKFNTPAIYFDFSTNYCTIQENTIYNRRNKGIFLNSGTNNNTVIGNVVYSEKYLLDFNGSPIIPTPMTGMTVKKNVLFAKDPNAYIIRMVDNTPGGYSQGIVDSNYYFQPYNSGKYALIAPSTDYTFAQWQATGLDPNTKSSFVNWTLPASYDSLFMNQTDNVVTISLGTTEFLDLDSNVVCGSITLQPYTSKILINNLTFCTTGIVESNFKNGISVFPNPFSSETIIQTNNFLNDATLTVYNLYGQTVKQIKNISRQEITLHRDNLLSGLYFIHLKQGNKIIAVEKFVITD